jgi:hypothetical protein
MVLNKRYPANITNLGTLYIQYKQDVQVQVFKFNTILLKLFENRVSSINRWLVDLQRSKFVLLWLLQVKIHSIVKRGPLKS